MKVRGSKAVSFFVTLILSVAVVSNVAADKEMDYSKRDEVAAFAKDYAKKHNKNVSDVHATLKQAKYKQSIIDAISKPAEFTMEWERYSKIFLSEKRIKQGVEFWKKHQKTLNAVSKKYQVEPEIILAVIGVETFYGTRMGNYRVLDALTTLGFDYKPRASFFKKELAEYLTMTYEQKLDAQKLMGSYAGAMGYGQFIPSSYRAYAKSHDGKGPIDIWTDSADAMASVANYLHVHKWRYGDLITIPVMGEVSTDLITKGLSPDKTVKQLRAAKVNVAHAVSGDAKVTLMKLIGNEGSEYWVGFNNFYVITRYNRSTLYSMAVFQLSQLLKYQMNAVK